MFRAFHRLGIGECVIPKVEFEEHYSPVPLMRVPFLALVLLGILLPSSLFSQVKSLSSVAVPVYTFNEKSISETTLGSEDHRVLAAALKAADLEEILHSQGPFTLFAPSDEAFTCLPEDKMEHLLKSEDKKALRSLLKYHIVAGEISASKILLSLCRGEGEASFTTVQGKKIFATIEGSDIILTDEFGNRAQIVKADSQQRNGVIHVIDNVIVPVKI
ncbi:fasciclin domain-containing protein [Allomuricauda sp. SCSIO 65647]|uniref:fasciclin domain-containing protein n=1 Tax=Allomuricauda sp. SCSIO 65647 TaxID=2908843 RepID=UPI001F2A91A1|nr:fasciclin domain-containing protein [Muricauda sp. SCSIO 65647]UJH67557.1 fasciclin domain-containing protein [Muricauda sp. SCSIO 65647]